jgi:hypothetical protein
VTESGLREGRIQRTLHKKLRNGERFRKEYLMILRRERVK